MHYKKTEAIVIKNYQKSAKLYTKELGKIYTNYKFSSKILLQTFNYLSMLLSKNTKNNLYMIEEVKVIQTFDNLKKDYKKLYLSYKVIKAIDELLIYPQKDAYLFDLLVDVLDYIQRYPYKREIYYLFLYKLVDQVGFGLSEFFCFVCNRDNNLGYFSTNLGVLCKDCYNNILITNGKILQVSKLEKNLIKLLYLIKQDPNILLVKTLKKELLSNLDIFFKNYIKYIYSSY